MRLTMIRTIVLIILAVGLSQATEGCLKLEDCLNGGICNISTNTCDCPPGFTGTRCSIGVAKTACALDPCKNGGICQLDVLSTEGYSCKCEPGFEGPLCDEDIDECTEEPCGAGQCINTLGGYQCNCPEHRVGDHCERKVDICELYESKNDSFCLNGGQCIFDRCDCSPGFAGNCCRRIVPLLQEMVDLGCSSSLRQAQYCLESFGDGVCDQQCSSHCCFYDGWDCKSNGSLSNSSNINFLSVISVVNKCKSRAFAASQSFSILYPLVSVVIFSILLCQLMVFSFLYLRRKQLEIDRNTDISIFLLPSADRTSILRETKLKAVLKLVESNVLVQTRIISILTLVLFVTKISYRMGEFDFLSGPLTYLEMSLNTALLAIAFIYSFLAWFLTQLNFYSVAGLTLAAILTNACSCFGSTLASFAINKFDFYWSPWAIFLQASGTVLLGKLIRKETADNCEATTHVFFRRLSMMSTTEENSTDEMVWAMKTFRTTQIIGFNNDLPYDTEIVLQYDNSIYSIQEYVSELKSQEHFSARVTWLESLSGTVGDITIVYQEVGNPQAIVKEYIIKGVPAATA